MTYNEFISLRDVIVKDEEHKKVIQLFYPYLQSVSGDKNLLLTILETIIGIDLADVTVTTGCFNGVNDNINPPYNNVDFYIRLSNGIKVYVYGKKLSGKAKLNENEYVVFLINDKITNNIIRNENRHILLK